MEILFALAIAGVFAAATDTGRKATKAGWKSSGARRGVIRLGEKVGVGANRGTTSVGRRVGAVSRWAGQQATARAERHYVARAVAQDTPPPVVSRVPAAAPTVEPPSASPEVTWGNLGAAVAASANPRIDHTARPRRNYCNWCGAREGSEHASECRDRQGQAKRASRRLDGKSETEADRRFFDLRESGYTGPIDQDGNKVTSGHAFDILNALRDTSPASTTTPQEEHMPVTRKSAEPNGILHVGEYEPETLSELILYCEQMARANTSMSEASEAFAETLTDQIGLDGQAVAGITNIGEQYAEVAEAWAAQASQLRSHYETVIEHVEAGKTLPKSPNFIDGQAA